VRSTFVNRDTLDQLLLQRFRGKVRCGLAAEFFHGTVNFPIDWNFALRRSSRATLNKMNLRVIMARCKH
jgi:hypothetical protein